MNLHVDTAILGAGPAGLRAAIRLGSRAVVFEGAASPGGLCRSSVLDGFLFDRAGHVLHFAHPENEEALRSYLDTELLAHERRAAIRIEDRFVPYPIQAHTGFLPPGWAERCGEEVAACAEAGRPGAAEDLEACFSACFGPALVDLFFRPYNVKLWCRPLDRLAADWVGEFVPRPGPEVARQGRSGRRQEGLGYNANFRYPARGGIESVPIGLASRAGDIRYGSRLVSWSSRRGLLHFADGAHVHYETLLSTIALTDLVALAEDLPTAAHEAAARLSHTSLWSLHLGIDRNDLNAFHWIYFPEERYPFFRVGFPHLFSPHNAPSGTSSLYVEFSFRGASPWEGADLDEVAREGLEEAGILRSGDRVLVREAELLPRAYPIHDEARATNLAELRGLLRACGVETAGRFGAWTYLSIDGAMEDGRAAAERLLERAGTPSASEVAR